MLKTFSFELLGSVLTMYPSVFYNVSGLPLCTCVGVIFLQSCLHYQVEQSVDGMEFWECHF